MGTYLFNAVGNTGFVGKHFQTKFGKGMEEKSGREKRYWVVFCKIMTQTDSAKLFPATEGRQIRTLVGEAGENFPPPVKYEFLMTEHRLLIFWDGGTRHCQVYCTQFKVKQKCIMTR